MDASSEAGSEKSVVALVGEGGCKWCLRPWTTQNPDRAGRTDGKQYLQRRKERSVECKTCPSLGAKYHVGVDKKVILAHIAEPGEKRDLHMTRVNHHEAVLNGEQPAKCRRADAKEQVIEHHQGVNHAQKLNLGVMWPKHAWERERSTRDIAWNDNLAQDVPIGSASMWGVIQDSRYGFPIGSVELSQTFNNAINKKTDLLKSEDTNDDVELNDLFKLGVNKFDAKVTIENRGT
jgi:hypothetical protein